MTAPLPEPSPFEDPCAALDHPGATYNPWLHRTWCACGAVTYEGDIAEHITCCGGPLDRRAPRVTTSGAATVIGNLLGGAA